MLGTHLWTMSVIGKKLTPIQSSGGHGDENTTTTNSQPSKITPDDVLGLNSITDDYLCSSGWEHFFTVCCLKMKKI